MTVELENYLKQVESLEKQKQGIIEKLLAQRSEIDAQLEKLGHSNAKKGGRPKGAKDAQKRTKKASTKAAG